MRKPFPQISSILRASLLALGVVSGAAMAQAWPSKVITLVVPFPAGGTTDVLARAVGVELAKSLGQIVIVENKGGAGATLGADYVAKARPDGYTLLVGAVHHTIATSVYKKLPYDFQRDFAPVTTIALVPNVLVVNPNLPAKNIAELLALAKASPGKLTYGSNGQGTGQHLIGAQFEITGGVKMLHVPYKGSGPLTVDLLGGQIDMSFDTITPVLSHIKAGKLRALAVTTIKRSPTLPDVPTLDESGLKGFDLGTWFGVLAPVATPKDVVTRLNQELREILAAPDVQTAFAAQGMDPATSTPDEFRKLVERDADRWARLIKAQGITAE